MPSGVVYLGCTYIESAVFPVESDLNRGGYLAFVWDFCGASWRHGQWHVLAIDTELPNFTVVALTPRQKDYGTVSSIVFPGYNGT